LACEHFERYVVRNMIERCNGNQSEAARRLGISRSTLKAKLDGRSASEDSDSHSVAVVNSSIATSFDDG
jgi:DNA-binding NtrC family response regulator